MAKQFFGDIDWREVQNIMEDMAKKSNLPPPTPIKSTNKPVIQQLQEQENIPKIEGSCFSCGKMLYSNEIYYSINKYFPGDTKTKVNYYCQDCWESIAGEDYE